MTVGGFNPNSPDASDEFARQNPPSIDAQPSLRCYQVVLILFLAGGPFAVMLLSLSGMIYLFTYNGLNQKTKIFQALYAPPVYLAGFNVVSILARTGSSAGGWSRARGRLGTTECRCLTLNHSALFRMFLAG